ncbi:MAG TPA: hypothetical protein VGH13_13210 [Xanthobacteraceae bacterium]|jgi:ElaB/YqjD/DUF883 family membrane-anchored ribosome-binding protein
MFHQRSSAFGPSVTAIQKHLGAVEKELEKLGRAGGRRASVAASEASEQIGDAVSTIVSDMIDRFRERGRAAGDGAARLGSQALKLGAGYGNDALQRVSTETEDRPLIMLGVALGIGVLIGAAILSNVNRQSR